MEFENPGHERKVFRLALFGGLPAVVVSIALLIVGGYSGKVQWTLGLVIVGAWLIVAALLRERVVRPLQTLSNLLGALREGDYSIRARGADRDDALGLAFLEANVLGETLRSQRLGAMEAHLLRKHGGTTSRVRFDEHSGCCGASRRRAACSTSRRAPPRPHAENSGCGLTPRLKPRSMA